MSQATVNNNCLICGRVAVEAPVLLWAGQLTRIHHGLCYTQFLLDNPSQREGVTEEQLLALKAKFEANQTDYSGYKWIKVKQHRYDPAKSWEENYRDLEQHHVAEAQFLIAEVRKLAGLNTK